MDPARRESLDVELVPFRIEHGDAVLTVLRAGLGGHPLAMQAYLDASWRRCYQID
jgi:hypothetical protein